MSRKCKCKICNKELTTDKAYKITRINNKTNKKSPHIFLYINYNP